MFVFVTGKMMGDRHPPLIRAGGVDTVYVVWDDFLICRDRCFARAPRCLCRKLSKLGKGR